MCNCDTTSGIIEVDLLVVFPGFGSLPKFLCENNPSIIGTKIPINNKNTLKSTKLDINSTLVVGYGWSSYVFLYESANSHGSEVLLCVIHGFITDMCLQTHEEETDANICTVKNGNHMLKFVAKHQLQNMTPK